MIPQNNNNIDLKADFTAAPKQTSRTYRMDHVRKRIVGYTDGREAMEQAIYKLLSTYRYNEIIYSWNYGAEILKLIGKPIPYVYSELKRLTTEALMQDDRVKSVDDFIFRNERSKVFMALTVNTIYGFIEIKKEVDI